MKIVDRKTFLALPAGVLFSKYQPCVFGPFLIKGESLANDWWEQRVHDAIDCTGSDDFLDKCIAAEAGASLTLDFDGEGRDGLYDEDGLFAVWEQGDIEALIERLKRCVGA